jgi:hypothetical protein
MSSIEQSVLPTNCSKKALAVRENSADGAELETRLETFAISV